MLTQRCRLYSVSSHSSAPAAMCPATAAAPPPSSAAQGRQKAAAVPVTSSGPHSSGTTHLPVSGAVVTKTVLMLHDANDLRTKHLPLTMRIVDVYGCGTKSAL
jgi:hypothetical protein